MSQKPEREMDWKRFNTLEKLLLTLEEKSRKPGISEPEQDHLNKTIKSLQKGFEELQRSHQSVDSDPEREDSSNTSDPTKTDESGICTSVPERISRSSEVTAAKRIKEFRNQEKVEADKDIFPQRPIQTKPIGEKIRNGPGDKSPTGLARLSSTETDKRPKTKTCSSGQDPTHDPTDRNDLDLRYQSNTPKDLKIDQRKSLLSGPGVHTNRKTLQKTHSLHPDKTLIRTGLAGQSMAAEAGTDHDLGEEVTSAKHRESVLRKGTKRRNGMALHPQNQVSIAETKST
jgi:hypothetical protein